MTNKDVFEKLKGLGSEISHEYVQAEKTELVKDEKIRKNGGICNALCHDWIRRVLQGGKLEFAQIPNSEKDVKSVLRSGHGQVKLLAPNIQQTIGLEQYQAAFELENALKSKGSMVAISEETAMILYRAGYLTVKTKGLLYERSLIQELYLKVGGGKNPEQSKQQSTMTKWKITTHYWDSYWSNQRGTKSPHPFRNIDQIADENKSEYSGVYAGIADKLKVLSAGEMAIIVDFHTKVKGTQGGHAIAAHRNNAGGYNFFDPNFGIFAYKGCENVATAMIFLIEFAYKAFGWETMHDDGRCALGNKTFVPVAWNPTVERINLPREGQFAKKGSWSGMQTVTKTVDDPPQLYSQTTRERVLKKLKQLTDGMGKGNGKVF